MSLSRRKFLRNTGATAALLQVPLAQRLFASPEPQRNPLVSGAIAINSNENAYGPLPSATKAMQDALVRGNRYPFGMYDPLLTKIASVNGVRKDQVVMGAGSTEMLRLAAQAFLAPGKNVVVADPTFEAMAEFGDALGAEVRKVPLTANYAHDLEAMLKRADSNTGLIYICNPNNPTASLTPANQIDQFIHSLPPQTVVLMDEAYHHFAMGSPEYRSFMPQADDRLIVMRTFSKIYGMAGIRLGYAVASAATINKMGTYRLPISVNTLAAAGGLASLDDEAAMKAAAERNAVDRSEFAKQAAARNVTMIPSFANFAMLKVNQPVKQVIDSFQQKGVLIGRPFPPMNDYVRVSFGLPSEMKAFWQAWDHIRPA
jgi:histidinol-phosphate aminotransferase